MNYTNVNLLRKLCLFIKGIFELLWVSLPVDYQNKIILWTYKSIHIFLLCLRKYIYLPLCYMTYASYWTYLHVPHISMYCMDWVNKFCSVLFWNFKTKNIPSADSELRNLKVTAYSLCVSGTVELQVTEYSVCGSGTSSRRLFYVWNISGSLFLMQWPEWQESVGATGPWVKAILEVLLFTVPSWRWPLLGFLCVFSVIIKQ